MKMLKKCGVALILAAATSIVPLFAESKPKPKSNTFFATAETIRSDADNFMDVRYFKNIDFSKVYAFTNLSYTTFRLGLAFPYKNMYFGTYYRGNFWGKLTSNNTSTKTTVGNNTTETTDVNGKNNDFNSEHNFSFLYGFNDMGFLLDAYINIDSDGKNHIANTNNNEYWTQNNNNTYDFDLTWGGLKLKAGKSTMFPIVKLGFSIIDNKQVITSNNTKNTTIKDDDRVTFNVGLGADFEFGKDTKYFSVVNVGYELDAWIYKDCNVYENKVNGDVINKQFRSGKYDIFNNVSLGYRFEYTPIEKLIIGGKANAKFAFDNWDPGRTSTDGSKPDGSDKKFTFDFTSDFAFGLKYNVVPSFALTFGYSGTLPKIHVFTENEKNDYSETKTVKTNTNSYSNNLYAGFGWNIGTNCLLDVGVKLPLTPSINSILDTAIDLGFSLKI